MSQGEVSGRPLQRQASRLQRMAQTSTTGAEQAAQRIPMPTGAQASTTGDKQASQRMTQLPTAAQTSTTGDEQAAQCYINQARKTFVDNLSNVDVAQASGPTLGRILSSRSEVEVANRIEQLQLSQLKSPQLKELVRRLKHLYKVESPKVENLRHENIPNPYADFRVEERWQEIQGCKQWDGLLDPLDPVLRAEIVRYGELAQAAYDAFDGDTSSKYCGSCKYTKESLLEKVGLENRGYEIYQYLYATAELDLPNFFTTSFLDDKWSKDSNWMGFVAVCTSPQEIARLGRRDIVVAWRGTITKFEWICDVQDYLAPAGFDPRNGNKNVMVESGFLSVYKSSNDTSRYNKRSAREQALGAVKELVDKYKGEKDTKLSITVTGHSLGSALATLCGYDLAESQINSFVVDSSLGIPTEWNHEKAAWESNPDSASNPNSATGAGSGPGGAGSLQKSDGKFFPGERIPITVFSFAGPRVGNRAFKDRMEELGVAVLRVANKHDMVTKVPGVIFTHAMEVLQKVASFLPSYKHVGVKLKIDSLASPFLQESTDPVHAHNLEGYLHVVDGFHGKKLPFEPTMRDYALANKGGDFLKKEYYIPPAWWQEAYKGLVRNRDGHWLLPVRDEELYPKTPLGQSPVKGNEKEEQERSFYRSVSIAFEKSSSKSDYVSIASSRPSQHSGEWPGTTTTDGVAAAKDPGAGVVAPKGQGAGVAADKKAPGAGVVADKKVPGAGVAAAKVQGSAQ